MGAHDRLVLAAALLGACLACGAPPTRPAPAPAAPGPEPAGVAALVSLGEKALAAGDVALAEDRFRRASLGAPNAASPRLGLARAALARGAPLDARRHAEAALERSPDDPDVLTALAEASAAAGSGEGREQARALLERALARDPDHVGAHARLMALSGPAPPQPPADTAAALRLARAHPYDRRARLRAARALAAEGRPRQAALHASAALWLATGDAQGGREAARLLTRIDPSWQQRSVVPVHVWADESVRADRDWPVRLRLLLRWASRTLDPVLGVAFVPVSFGAFASAGASDELEDIHERLRRQSVRSSEPGLVAGFTGRGPPRRPGTRRLGQAGFLGRGLIVRLEPGARESRTLLHELLHLYGAVHIAEAVDSLMNPSGDSLVLDAANLRIVTLVRQRRFGPGGLAENVFPFVNLAALTEAFARALRADLDFRRLGILEARQSGAESRYLAARKARAARALDPHLADVSRLLARLLLAQGRAAAAARMLEVESRLRGVRSARGQAAAREAAALRRRLGVPGS